MDRRAFFSVVRRGRLRVLELSCDRLYLRWVDARGRACVATPGETVTLEHGERAAGITASAPTAHTTYPGAPPVGIAVRTTTERTGFDVGGPPTHVAVATATEDAALYAAESPAHVAVQSAAEDTASEVGEPPTRIAAETAVDLFESLERRLADADVVRVAGREWLQEDELRRRVDAALEAFERRGGRVEHEGRVPSSPARALTLVIGLLVLGAAPTAAQSNGDEVLRTRVEAALAAAADLPADSISVQVQDGVVTLSGSVACEGCGGNATPGGAGTVQQSLGAVVRAIPGVTDLRFQLRYAQPAAR